MSQMDQQTLHELHFIALEQIDASFNIWMSATFALLIATYLVAAKLKKRIIYVLAILYLSFSLLYFFRVVYSGLMARMYMAEMDFIVPLETFGLVPLLRLVVFGFGTIATLYFLLRSAAEIKDG